MPNDLYFTAVGFSSVFLTPNLWGHWTDFNQIWIHIYLKLLFEKSWSELPRAFTPAGWGKKPFLWPTLKFDRTCLCNGTWHQKSERNLSIYRDSPTCPSNLVNFVAETAENGWRVFARPAKYSHWETLSALPHGRYIKDSRQTLARVMKKRRKKTTVVKRSCSYS